MPKYLRYVIGFTVICLLLAAPFAAAQDRGTITGTITDSSGAAVPGASVILRHPDTGLSQTTISGAEGGFSLLYLSAGKYTLTVEMPGFRKAEVADVKVSVNTTTRMDIQLQVGAVSETVEVLAAATLLQTDRSDIGRVVDNRAIQRLPLFIGGGLRSNLSFAGLNPGVQMNLTNDPDTTVFWQANSQNAAGQVTSELLGNGLTSSCTYDTLVRKTGTTASNAGGANAARARRLT